MTPKFKDLRKQCADPNNENIVNSTIERVFRICELMTFNNFTLPTTDYESAAEVFYLCCEGSDDQLSPESPTPSPSVTPSFPIAMSQSQRIQKLRRPKSQFISKVDFCNWQSLGGQQIRPAQSIDFIEVYIDFVGKTRDFRLHIETDTDNWKIMYDFNSLRRVSILEKNDGGFDIWIDISQPPKQVQKLCDVSEEKSDKKARAKWKKETNSDQKYIFNCNKYSLLKVVCNDTVKQLMDELVEICEVECIRDRLVSSKETFEEGTWNSFGLAIVFREFILPGLKQPNIAELCRGALSTEKDVMCVRCNENVLEDKTVWRKHKIELDGEESCMQPIHEIFREAQSNNYQISPTDDPLHGLASHQEFKCILQENSNERNISIISIRKFMFQLRNACSHSRNFPHFGTFCERFLIILSELTKNILGLPFLDSNISLVDLCILSYCQRVFGLNPKSYNGQIVLLSWSNTVYRVKLREWLEFFRDQISISRKELNIRSWDILQAKVLHLNLEFWPARRSRIHPCPSPPTSTGGSSEPPFAPSSDGHSPRSPTVPSPSPTPPPRTHPPEEKDDYKNPEKPGTPPIPQANPPNFDDLVIPGSTATCVVLQEALRRIQRAFPTSALRIPNIDITQYTLLHNSHINLTTVRRSLGEDNIVQPLMVADRHFCLVTNSASMGSYPPDLVRNDSEYPIIIDSLGMYRRGSGIERTFYDTLSQMTPKQLNIFREGERIIEKKEFIFGVVTNGHRQAQGSNDCAVCVIAQTVDALSNPSNLKRLGYSYNNRRLRGHMAVLLENQEWTPFPRMRGSPDETQVEWVHITAHCICGRPDSAEVHYSLAQCIDDTNVFYHSFCRRLHVCSECPTVISDERDDLSGNSKKSKTVVLSDNIIEQVEKVMEEMRVECAPRDIPKAALWERLSREGIVLEKSQYAAAIATLESMGKCLETESSIVKR